MEEEEEENIFRIYEKMWWTVVNFNDVNRERVIVLRM